MILRVAIPRPLPRLYDYLAIPDSRSRAQVGARVLVHFANTQAVGVIIEIKDHSDVAASKLKTIIEILDPEPLFSPKFLQLITWAAAYYHYPLGLLLQKIIPKWLRQKQSDICSTQIADKACNTAASIITLNAEQQLAVDTIDKHADSFQTFLLDGVTGSGKTAVYTKLIANTLARNKQCLVLIPEINLGPQTLEFFESQFSVPVLLLHSKISDKARALSWLQAAQHKASIIIGTRLAAFTPLQNPGLFIIDEEHDQSFKQTDSFRYNARDLLQKRAQLENCPIVLGTASPSIESWYNTRAGRYQHIELKQRAVGSMPKISLIDTRNQKLQAGLTEQAIQAISRHLSNQRQVLVFINRRGYAPTLYCQSCGWHKLCRNCDANMVLHANNKLQCHHCNAVQSMPAECPKCNSTELTGLGSGTQRVEQELAKIFSNYQITRIDADQVKNKTELKRVLKSASSYQSQILVGTQMLAKGHNFPKLSLVVILEVDNALYSSDFRAIEHMGQTITQVAGRAGRYDTAGEVLIQSSEVEHPSLKTLVDSGYHALLEQILAERRTAALPPFSRQILLRARAKSLSPAIAFLNKFSKIIHAKYPLVKAQGPIPGLMPKKQGDYRAVLLLSASQRKHLQIATRSTLTELALTNATSNRWSVDVDPLDMY